MTLLAAEGRKLYTDCLSAPQGYRFDRGIATTFTLSLEALLVLPFTLATQGVEEPQRLLADPVALLESLQETAHRLAVFCHEGYTSVPSKGQLLYGLLDHCVVPVRPAPPSKFFHPKLWLLRFVGEAQDEVVLRAVVLSRNLTFDRSWDTVQCSDGRPGGRRVKESFGLETLVAALPGLAGPRISAGQRELCAQLADEAARTRFETPEPFRQGPVFHAIGVPGKGGKRLPFEPLLEGNPKRLLCVSPFLSKEAMDEARLEVPTQPILITKDAATQPLEDATLADWDVRVLADAVETGESADDAADPRSLTPAGGLHAKINLYEDKQGRAVWFMGSANLTKAGWTGLNVELMVELIGGVKACGIDAFLGGGFEEVLEPWTRSEPDPEEEAREALRARADAHREAIVQAGLGLRCVPPGADEGWALELVGTPPVAPPGVECTAWPVTAELAVFEKALTPGRRWVMNSAAELTGLVAFAATATQEQPKRAETIQFVLRLPVEGLPAARDAAVLRALVKDTKGFFRYLRYLLASEDDAVPGLRSATRAGDGDGDNGFSLGFQTVILEDLVRGLSRNPGQLRRLARRIEDLRQTDEGQQVIPASFLELWKVVTRALPEEVAR